MCSLIVRFFYTLKEFLKVIVFWYQDFLRSDLSSLFSFYPPLKLAHQTFFKIVRVTYYNIFDFTHLNFISLNSKNVFRRKNYMSVLYRESFKGIRNAINSVFKIFYKNIKHLLLLSVLFVYHVFLFDSFTFSFRFCMASIKEMKKSSYCIWYLTICCIRR